MSELRNEAVVKKKEVFLYNPYADSKKKAKDVVLAAGETAYFDVVLANPFLFDLDIQSIWINATGIEFEPIPTSLKIPAATRSYKLRLSGIPHSNGFLKIHGCIVRLFGGCLEETIFPIQKALESPTKARDKDGKRRKQEERERFGKKALQGGAGVGDAVPQTIWSIPVSVVKPQPLLDVTKSHSVGLGALMVFEGERTSFKLTLENIGKVRVSYIRLSIVENYSPDAPVDPAEGIESAEVVYERDVHRHSIRAFWLGNWGHGNATRGVGGLVGADDLSVQRSVGGEVRDTIVERLEYVLECGERMDLEIGVFGKKWCSGATVVIDYGDVAVSTEEEHYYVRQLTVPILMTVQPAMEIQNWDILPLRGPLSTTSVLDFWSQSARLSDSETGSVTEEVPPILQKALSLEDMFVDHFKSEQTLERDADYFIVTFDIRNVWQQPLEVEFDVYSDSDSSKPETTIKMIVYPNLTKRIILPVHRITMTDTECNEPIPMPSWKQFVLSRSEKLSPDQHKIRRSIFWMKEFLIGGLKHSGRVVGRWNCGRGRHGVLGGALRDSIVESSGGRLDTEIRWLRFVKSEEVGFAVTVRKSTGSAEQGELVPSVGPNRYRCMVRTFVVLEWTLTNRTDTPCLLCLRAHPVQETESGFVDCVAEGKVLVSGSLHVPVEELKTKGASAVIRMPLMFLQKGLYRVLAHAEDLVKPSKAGGGEIHWSSADVFIEVIG
ncbi:hypothetical protein HDV05_007358 [Chytridiales sp. JEL 0842]|nr:hypothetical protein HDV05_007358 [Chytridiales sp. JEL 0842]